jgi:Tetratricopeptide repeat
LTARILPEVRSADGPLSVRVRPSRIKHDRDRVLGEDHPDTLASADNLAFSLQGVRGQAARELGEDTLARRRRILGDEHPETMMAGAFDLILRGLDLGGEPGWMAALREASKRRQQEAGELNEDSPG